MPTSNIYSQLPVQVTETSNSVPTVAADLTTVDTALFQMTLQNGTGSSITMTLKAKGDASFIPVVFSVDPNTPYILNWPQGLLFSGGLNWVASGANLIATVRGLKKGPYSLTNGLAA